MTDFKIEEMPHSRISLILGQRESGKTKLLCHLINNNKWIDKIKTIYIMTTNSSDTVYADIVPTKQKFLFRPKDINILEELIMLQKIKQQENITDHIVIVIDDCITFASNLTKKEYIRDIFFNNRAYRISLYLTMQYPFNLSTELRCQIDYKFVLQNGTAVITKIHEQYAKYLLPFDSFYNIYKNLDNKNKVMVITHDNNVTWFCLNKTNSNQNKNDILKYVESDGETNIIFDDIIHYYKDDNNHIVI